MDRFLCPFPWLSPCVTTDGHFRVCPVSQSAASRGRVANIDGSKPHIEHLQSLGDIMNTDSLKDLRRRMITGADVSDTCHRCLSEEKNGLQSRRQMELVRIPEFTAEFAQNFTWVDGSLRENIPIATLIIRMGNKCNLICRMCGPSSSSAWYQEWADTRHRGYQEENGRIALTSQKTKAVTPTPNPYTWAETPSAMRLVEMCGPSLRRIHFSGGEPLLSKGHLEILRYLAQSGRAARISLDYNSNLTVLSDEVLSLWSRFESVEIGISVDGPPEVNEYIRYPLKTSTLVKNLHRLDSSEVRGKFWLSTTVQIYNVMDLTALESWLQDQKFKKIQSKIAWHALRSPKELSLFALPAELKQQIASTYANSKSFKRLSQLVFEEDFSESFGDFIQTTLTMDAYRGQSVRNLANLWNFIGEHFHV